MTIEEFEALPQEQQEATRKLQERSGIAWDEFLEQAWFDHMFKTVMVANFHGMVVGIEQDGYTHS